jgi:DnaJ-domain-containing protein 1
MLWKLDSFFQQPLHASDESIKEPEETEPEQDDNIAQANRRKRRYNQEDKVLIETEGDVPDSSTNSHEQPNKIIFLPEDYEYARVLGLEKPIDLKVVKSTYRKIIAQYHPDRVVAMGPEIKEVAEKKAKEINEAYEHLRKKFDLS